MNWKILNIIKMVPLIPFLIIASPALLFFSIIIFFITDWEKDWERDNAIRFYKGIISFGFWK